MKFNFCLSGSLLLFFILQTYSARGQAKLTLIRADNPKKLIVFTHGNTISITCADTINEQVYRTYKKPGHYFHQKGLAYIDGQVTDVSDSTISVKVLLKKKHRLDKAQYHMVTVPVRNILRIRKYYRGVAVGMAIINVPLSLSFLYLPYYPLTAVPPILLVAALNRMFISPDRKVHPTAWNGNNRWQFGTAH